MDQSDKESAMSIPDRLWPNGPVDLPPEAGNIAASHFEPNEEWLTQAAPEFQQAAMWRWFASRFEDPYHAVPHNEHSEDFMWGDGEPIRADRALAERFDTLVPPSVINSVSKAVRDEVGNEWAIKRLDKVGA
jgi:hypothetical protein